MKVYFFRWQRFQHSNNTQAVWVLFAHALITLSLFIIWASHSAEFDYLFIYLFSWLVNTKRFFAAIYQGLHMSSSHLTVGWGTSVGDDILTCSLRIWPDGRPASSSSCTIDVFSFCNGSSIIDRYSVSWLLETRSFFDVVKSSGWSGCSILGFLLGLESFCDQSSARSASCGLFASLSVALSKDMFVAAQMGVGGLGPMLIPLTAAAAANWT